MRFALALSLTVAFAGQARADTASRGRVALELRAFDPDDLEETNDVGASLFSELEFDYSKKGLHASFQGFARLATFDSSRNLAAIQEANVSYSMGPLQFLVGAKLLNWTATEAFHPADIINSQNFDSNPLDPEKFGEPMAEITFSFFRGNISAFYMPMRIPPRLVPPSSRLTLLEPGTALGEVTWVNRDGQFSDDIFQHQAGVRINQSIGPVDVAVHYVDHNQRQQLAVLLDGKINPVYQSAKQLGFNYTQVAGGLVLKLEGSVRRFYEIDEEALEQLPFELDPLIDHEIVAGGLEYAWTTLSGASISALIEAQFVLGVDDREDRERLHPFQRDALVAYRHAWNDLKGRELLVGVISDLDSPSQFAVTSEFSQRLINDFTIEARFLGFRQVDSDSFSLNLILARHF